MSLRERKLVAVIIILKVMPRTSKPLNSQRMSPRGTGPRNRPGSLSITRKRYSITAI